MPFPWITDCPEGWIHFALSLPVVRIYLELWLSVMRLIVPSARTGHPFVFSSIGLFFHTLAVMNYCYLWNERNLPLASYLVACHIIVSMTNLLLLFATFGWASQALSIILFGR